MIAVDLLIGNPTVVNYAANSNVQQQLQNNYAMEYLAMRLSGTLTLASYTTAPAKYVESIENLLAYLYLQATGKSTGATTDQLCAVDGPFLRLKTRLLEGTDVSRVDIGTANGTYAFETNLKRYFIDPLSDATQLTTLYTDVLNALTASFQFRDQTAMVYGGVAGTAMLSGVQITTQARQYLGKTMPSPSPYIKETQRTLNVTQSQNLIRTQKAPVGNVLRRQYWKGMVGPVNFADPSDTIFGATGKPEGPHLQLVLNNSTTKLDQVYQQVRAENKVVYGVETMPTGYAVYEPAGRLHKLRGSLPLKNVQDADNYVDVNYTGGSTNTIQITDEQIVNLSAAQLNAGK